MGYNTRYALKVFTTQGEPASEAKIQAINKEAEEEGTGGGSEDFLSTRIEALLLEVSGT